MPHKPKLRYLSSRLSSRTQKKSDLSMNDYLLKIKALVDQLASVGHVLTIKVQIGVIFDGLSYDYDTFIVLMNSRNDPYKVVEIESLLLV